jgi:hypothetical protein
MHEQKCFAISIDFQITTIRLTRNGCVWHSPIQKGGVHQLRVRFGSFPTQCPKRTFATSSVSFMASAAAAVDQAPATSMRTKSARRK